MARVSRYRVLLRTGLTHRVGQNTITFAYNAGDVQGSFAGNGSMLIVNGGKLLLFEDTDTYSLAFGASLITLTWLSEVYRVGDTDDLMLLLDIASGFDVTPSGAGVLLASSNLSDLTNPGAAVTNLGLDDDMAALAALVSGAMLKSANLGDVANVATARTNLGLVIGTNVLAYDAEVQALASLISAADKAPYYTGAGTAALMTVTAAARTALAGADAAAIRTAIGALGIGEASGGDVNLLDNPDFQICQGAPSTGAVGDGGYPGVDAYRVVQESSFNDVFRSTTGSLPANSRYRLRVSNDTANNKFGILQVVPSNRVIRLRGLTVAMAFDLAVSNARIGDVRAAIIEWTGTADVTTADIISAWNAAGTNPTLAANFSYLNTPANLNPTTGWQTIATITGLVGASASNLLIFIWNDDKTTAISDEMILANLRFNEGAVAAPMFYRNFADDFTRCRRRYWRTFPYGVAPSQDFAAGPAAGSGMMFMAGKAGAAAQFSPTQFFPVPLLKVATFTTYNSDAANAQVRDVTAAADCSAAAVVSDGLTSFFVTATGNASTAVGNKLEVGVVADARP